MEVIIVKKEFNKYLDRLEIVAKVRRDKEQPKIKELREAILKAAKEEGEPIILLQRYVYGGKYLKVLARIYKNKDIIEKIEPEFVIKKNYGGEATAEKAA
jgi:ribosomal protein S24E